MRDEKTIFLELKHCLKKAAESCVLIANHPLAGEEYIKMRALLKQAEKCCVEIADLREDARWLRFGMVLEVAHQKARNWLATPEVKQEGIVYNNTVLGHKMFSKLAEALKQNLVALGNMQHKATGYKGIILPESISKNAGYRPREASPGIILPAGY